MGLPGTEVSWRREPCGGVTQVGLPGTEVSWRREPCGEVR